MDPARETYEELPNTVEQIFHHLNFKLKTILEYFIIFFITIFYISFIMDSSSNVKHFCDINKADISSMPYICQLNSEGKIMDKSSMHYFNFIIFPCIYLGVKIMIRRCMKYHPDINAALNQRIKTYFQTKWRITLQFLINISTHFNCIWFFCCPFIVMNNRSETMV